MSISWTIQRSLNSQSACARRKCSRAKALRFAWLALKAKRKLWAGETKFSYVKVDGSTKVVNRGTTNPSLIPAISTFTKPSGSKRDPMVQYYYDLDAQGWRQYNIAKLVSVE